jgi:hypothetical protein
VEVVESLSAVQDMSSATPDSMHPRTHYAHKPVPFHSTFRPACGRGGKQGTLLAISNPFIQKCRIAQRRYGKLSSYLTLYIIIIYLIFPLFILHYGYYDLLSSLFPHF